MKLPSIQQVAADAGRTLRRFPFVLANAAIGTATALILADHEGPARPSILFNILFATVLGIPLLISTALTAEKRKWSPLAAFAAQCAALLALAAYGWSVPSDLASAPALHFYRLLMIAAGLLLFVAVAPYAAAGETNGFWHYNKALLMRVITAGLFSMVLFAGLGVALAALDNLFGVAVPPKRYGELWIFVVGMFTTWFFVGGIPERLDELEGATDYPKVIKIFGQYILLPLVVVYLVILYAYMGKILVAWDWPQGWVSRLILGFATLGMLMHLLFYPVRDRDENRWIASACRWFYVVLVPMVVVLMLAVWRRISEYGVTEGRYIAVVTGLWLGAIVLYFIVSKGKSIKIIPSSLGVISLVICFGPWGAFHISESSQISRLEELLTRSSILIDGTVHPATKPVPFEQTKQISSIIQYLHEVHGYDGIQHWFRESLRTDSTASRSAYKDPTLVAKLMGVEYVRIWEGTALKEISLRVDAERALEVRGYDRLSRFQIAASSTVTKEISGSGLGYRAHEGLDTLILYPMTEGRATDSVVVDMKQFIEKLSDEYQNANPTNIPPERMSMTLSNDRLKVKLFLNYVHGRREDGAVKLTMYDCTILYSNVTVLTP